MNGFLRPPAQAEPRPSARELVSRTPRRISTTLSWRLHQQLQERADMEGRSVSNLVSFLLEQSLATGTVAAMAAPRR